MCISGLQTLDFFVLHYIWTATILGYFVDMYLWMMTKVQRLVIVPYIDGDEFLVGNLNLKIMKSACRH